MSQKISIKQGDSFTVEETITGIVSLDGYTAKLYIKTTEGTEVDTITGIIANLVITYEALNERTRSYPVGGHEFETKVFDINDHVFTPSDGSFIVEKALINNPV